MCSDSSSEPHLHWPVFQRTPGNQHFQSQFNLTMSKATSSSRMGLNNQSPLEMPSGWHFWIFPQCLIGVSFRKNDSANLSWPQRQYSPRNSPGQNTGVGSLPLLQGIFPTQGLNPGLLHCRRILYQLSHREAIRINGGTEFHTRTCLLHTHTHTNTHVCFQGLKHNF